MATSRSHYGIHFNSHRSVTGTSPHHPPTPDVPITPTPTLPLGSGEGSWTYPPTLRKDDWPGSAPLAPTFDSRITKTAVWSVTGLPAASRISAPCSLRRVQRSAVGLGKGARSIQKHGPSTGIAPAMNMETAEKQQTLSHLGQHATNGRSLRNVQSSPLGRSGAWRPSATRPVHAIAGKGPYRSGCGLSALPCRRYGAGHLAANRRSGRSPAPSPCRCQVEVEQAFGIDDTSQGPVRMAQQGVLEPAVADEIHVLLLTHGAVDPPQGSAVPPPL